MLCEPLDMLPVECVRGYLSGSAWTYQTERSICGLGLPPGLKDRLQLPKASSPATKAALGEHDENVTFDEVVVAIGQEEAQEVKRMSLDVYLRAAEIAASAGSSSPTQVRVRHRDERRERRPHRARRRGADAGLLALLADRHLGAGRPAAVVRQAVRARLAHVPGVGWDRHSGRPRRRFRTPSSRRRAQYIEAYERLTGRTFA
jgi:phosphoribosylaminoimidazole-succinocarboxamide synthase